MFGREATAREAPVEVRAKRIDGTCARAPLSARRLRAHASTSRALAEAVSASGATFGEVARSLEISPSRAQDFGDPAHPAAITLRDLRAMAEGGARATAIAVLRAELETIEDSAPPSRIAPERHALRLGTTIGALQAHVDDAIADGTISPDERRELLRDLAALAGRITAMRRDLEALR